MSAERSRRRGDTPLDPLVNSLTRDQLVEVVVDAAKWHDDVARGVRLVAARKEGNLGALRTEVDRAFRTRRFLDYQDSIEWARAAHPVVAELERAVRTMPLRELVELLQRAVGHIVKVLRTADDSSGLIGSLAHDLLALHARACDAGVADPVKLASWMIEFGCADQDYFELDPARYATALGNEGMAVYRTALDRVDNPGSYAVRYVRERLAVFDRDIEAIVRLHGRELSNPFQFAHVADAMAEIGRDDLVLEWTARGIAETHGWQIGELYDRACEAHARLQQPLEILRLRRAHHERQASLSAYAALREAARDVDAWEVERDAARAALQKRDIRGFIDALLSDDDRDLAWDAAVAAAPDRIDRAQWLRLAESREAEHPGDAFAVYQAVAEEVLQQADRRAYYEGVRILKRAARAADVGERGGEFSQKVGRLREQYRRRPTLIAMLDKAGFV
jgi:hypothetical protein